MKFYCCIVIYNADILKSPAFKSLKDKAVDIIVIDNSVNPNNNKQSLEEFKNVIYIKQKENFGLSKAYNTALDKIFLNAEKTEADDSVFCIFDDDTEVPFDYIPMLKAIVKKNSEYDIFVPVITDKVGIMSPSLMKNGINRRLNTLDFCENDIVAINSCMAVRLSVFKSYRYDENMFMDYVDFNFLRDMRSLNKKLFIIKDYKIFQNFSSNIYDMIKEAERFKIYKKDLKYYYNKAFFSYLKVILRRRAKLCLKYKTLRFLFI